MKPDQRFTPKYWVFHDKYTDDVYLDTAAKGWRECVNIVSEKYPSLYKEFGEDDSRYSVDLIEVKPVYDPVEEIAALNCSIVKN